MHTFSLASFDSLTDAFLELFSKTHTLIGIGLVLFIGLQITAVLCGMYMKPIRSPKQLLKLVLILFAGVAICCMTVWLLWKLASA